jgi:hypothetical protein
VRRLFQEHLAGTRQHWDRLWILLTVEVWLQMFDSGTLWTPRRSEAATAVDVTEVTHRCYG